MLALFRIGGQVAVTYDRLQKDKRLRYPVTERKGQVAIIQQLRQERAASICGVRRFGM